MAASGTQVPLSAAALQLQMSYDRTRRLVLTGELKGEQVAGRFWVVDLASIESVKREREAAAA